MSNLSPTRRPLHERNNSQSNAQAIRLVPSTPPQLLGHASHASTVRPIWENDVYSKTPLPTHPSHILTPGNGKPYPVQFATPASDESFQNRSTPLTGPQSTDSSTTPRRMLLQSARNAPPATGSPTTQRRAPTKKRLQIHKDGRTFSLLRDDAQASSDNIVRSPISSPASFKSFDSLPSYASNTEPRTSGISTFYATEGDSTLTTIPGTPPAVSSENSPSADPAASSIWSRSLVGGVRKVPKTPDSKQEAVSPELTSLPPLPTLSEVSHASPSASRELSAKPSFQSYTTVSTVSENSNYKTYRSQSLQPDELVPTKDSSNSNYHIISDSSPDTTIIHRPPEPPSECDSEIASLQVSRQSSILQRPHTATSEANYELHGDPSSSDLNLALPTQYSHESLVIPALKPRARRSHERLGYYKSRSRESLRSRTGSITSITTVLSQREALRAVLSSGSLVNHLPTLAKGPSSWAEPSINIPQQSYMNEHPHQWSSQLSTVMSVSDAGSGRNSRTWSEATAARSSGPSRQSRAVYSIGSSNFAPDDYRLRIDLPATPQPTHIRGQRHLSSGSVPIIESQDEYGDGITDLQDLRTRPSRRRLSGYYSIESPDPTRTNTMRSTSSSMTATLLANSLPTWAQLYYGSGERRYLGALGAPSSSTEGTDSRANSFRDGSPNLDNFPLGIYSPRRRPRDSGAHRGQRVASGSMDITPAGAYRDGQQAGEGQHATRFRTWSLSSVWSPHLRLDRHAQRQSVWEAPSINWSTEGGWFGRRNMQIVMFIVGFVFPFAWMIAAFLPLPPRPLQEMQERDDSTSNLGASNHEFNDYERQFGPMDEARYESAKWWRRLNRWMSLVGAIIIAIIIVLVIVSLREGW